MKTNVTTKAKQSKKIRKGDKVIVLAGNDRGQVGTVLAINGRKALVQGINVRKKHVRPTQENPKGNIISRENFLDSSNLRLCTDDETPIKLYIRQDEKGKHFVYKKDGKEVVYRTVKTEKKG